MLSLDSPWIDVIAAIVGGIALGYGIGRLAVGFTVASGVWTILGLILLWWALSDRRRTRRKPPRADAMRSHTVE